MNIWIIAEIVKASKKTVRKILHEKLNMKKICAKLVPKNLTPDQELIRQQICSAFLKRLEEEPEFMENIIACNKSWIFQYDVETKRQTTHWKTPALSGIRKASISKSKF